MKEDYVCIMGKYIIDHDDEMMNFIFRTIATMVFPPQGKGKSKSKKKIVDKNRRDREDYFKMLANIAVPLSLTRAMKINTREKKAIIRGVLAGDIYRRICFYRLQGMENISPYFLEWAIQKGAFPEFKKNGFPVSEIRHVLSASRFKRVGHLWAADCYLRQIWKDQESYRTLDAIIAMPGLFLAYADLFRKLSVNVGFIENKQQGAWMPQGWKKVAHVIRFEGATMSQEWEIESEKIQKLYKEYYQERAWER